jgi:hypothetical protein
MISIENIKGIDGFLQYQLKEIKPFSSTEILIKDLTASTEYNIHITENIMKNDGKLNMTDEINETNIIVSTAEEPMEHEWFKMAPILQWIELSAAIKSNNIINFASQNSPIILMPTQNELNEHFKVENGEIIEIDKSKKIIVNKLVLDFIEWWIGPQPLFSNPSYRSQFLLHE